MGRMNLPTPTLGLSPAKAEPVFGVRPLYCVEVPPSATAEESRPPETRTLPVASVWGDAKSAICAPAAMAQLIAAAEKPPEHPKFAVVAAMVFLAAVTFRLRAAPLWFTSCESGIFRVEL